MADIVVDYTNIMAPAVGKANGLTDEEIAALAPLAKEAHKRLAVPRKKGKLPFFDLPYKIADAKKIVREAKKFQAAFDTLVVLGIGGSALGTVALREALLASNHNELSAKKRPGMRLLVLDNIDPDQFADLLGGLNLKTTLFNVISKSGSTAETAAQFLIVTELLRKRLGSAWKRHLVVTTDPRGGSLRPLVERFRLKSYEVPDGVGGRFTVFTPVSLFPAACAGIDIVALLNGAARMADRTAEAKVVKNPAYLFAALSFLLDTRKAKKMLVMMPYSSKLYTVADWFRQLWAESLGKKVDWDGNRVHTGQTPIKALGATDQHSQVQLYVEGPYDKAVCFIEVERFASTVKIPKMFVEMSAFGYLGGRTMNELMSVEQRGTEYALTANNRPHMTIKLPDVSPDSVGQLLYLLEVATAFAGGLYRIDPFDQPGVEFGKQFTYAMFGRDGFADKADAYRAAMGGAKRTI
jgi:glucose-6-phosphate isomerase